MAVVQSEIAASSSRVKNLEDKVDSLTGVNQKQMELLQTIHKELAEVKKSTKTGKTGNAGGQGAVLMNKINAGMMQKVTGQTAMQGLFKQQLAQKFQEQKEWMTDLTADPTTIVDLNLQLSNGLEW